MADDEYSAQHYGSESSEINNESYVYHESSSIEDDTMFSVVKSKRKGMDAYLNSDPSHKIIGKKYDRLEYYASSRIPGMPIRNAVTGIREYNMPIGSISIEAQFFKVCYAANDSTNMPDTLYYDSPEQFERHMRCNVNSETKHTWKRKYDKHTIRYNEQ